MIEKKIIKNKTIATRFTQEQNDKLKLLAEKKGISVSFLLNQLVEIGYLQVTKNKTF